MNPQVVYAPDLTQCLSEARAGDPAARAAFQRDVVPLVRLIARRQLRQPEAVLPGGPPQPPGVDALTRRICRRLLQVVRGDTLVGAARETLPGDARR